LDREQLVTDAREDVLRKVEEVEQEMMRVEDMAVKYDLLEE